MLFYIWRSAVAPSDATENNYNIDAQLQSLLYTTVQIYLGKFTSYMTFGVHKLFVPSRFWTPDAKFDIIAAGAI